MKKGLKESSDLSVTLKDYLDLLDKYNHDISIFKDYVIKTSDFGNYVTSWLTGVSVVCVFLIAWIVSLYVG